MAKYIVMTVGATSVHFRVSDEEGETVYSGSEPFASSHSADIARASIRATAAATRWAAHNGGIEGLEIIGQ